MLTMSSWKCKNIKLLLSLMHLQLCLYSTDLTVHHYKVLHFCQNDRNVNTCSWKAVFLAEVYWASVSELHVKEGLLKNGWERREQGKCSQISASWGVKGWVFISECTLSIQSCMDTNSRPLDQSAWVSSFITDRRSGLNAWCPSLGENTKPKHFLFCSWNAACLQFRHDPVGGF